MTRFRAGLLVSVNQYCFSYLVGVNGVFNPCGLYTQAEFYLGFLAEVSEREGRWLFFGKMDALEAKEASNMVFGEW